MISVQKNFLFIHVPKTGGNSIQTLLKTYSEDRIQTRGQAQDGIERFGVRSDRYGTWKHSTLADYQAAMEPELFGKLFKFATIRNPWDKMISHYFSPHTGLEKWHRASFVMIASRVDPLRHYISLGSSETKLGQDIDFLLRFEHLEEDFQQVCQTLGIPYTQLPVRNKSVRQAYASYYDEELKEMVRKRFAEEIEWGHYEFEPT